MGRGDVRDLAMRNWHGKEQWRSSVERGNEKSARPAAAAAKERRNARAKIPVTLRIGILGRQCRYAIQRRPRRHDRLFRMQPRFASVPLVLYEASSPGASAASVESQATSLIDWHVSIATERQTATERERNSALCRAYTYLAYSMIGRRLITIEIGSRVATTAIPTRVTALLGLRRA